MTTPHGIIPAMVTPLTMDDEINVPALRKLTNYQIDAGVHGLFSVGSQGEFWALSADEKRLVWQIVLEEANGRVPVYAGTAAISTRETIKLTQIAEEVGVAAVSVLTPFYVSPTEDELYSHYRTVAESTSLPVMLYPNPGRTGVRLSPRLLVRLAEIENIVGIKDSSGDLELTSEYIRLTPSDFSVLMGRDTLILGALVYGAHGAIAASASVAPALAVKIYDCFKAGDLEGARRAQAALAPLRQAFTWGTFPVVVKEATDLIGMEGGPARGPVGPMQPEQRARLAQVLRDIGLI